MYKRCTIDFSWEKKENENKERKIEKNNGLIFFSVVYHSQHFLAFKATDPVAANFGTPDSFFFVRVRFLL